MSSRTFTWNAYETQLTSDLVVGQTSATVANADDLTAPVYLVLDPENASLREWIKVTAITANTFDTIERGLAGSVGVPGDGSLHLSGASVRAVYTKQVQDDLFFDIEALEGDTGTVITDLANHISNDVDPHAAAGYVRDIETTPFLRLDGTSVVSAAIPFAGFKLTGLGAPTADTDASTKKYVDDLVAGTLSEPLVLDQLLTLSTIQARTNDLIFRDAAGALLLLWDESQDRWEFSRTLDMQGKFLQNPANPTSDGHVGDRGYNNTQYLKIAANAVSASKWNTARTLTTTLAGDLTGSAGMSVDGSANRTATITAVVKNDSHTHDTQYLKLSGGTLTNVLTGTRFIANEGSVTAPAFVLSEPTNDTGLYAQNSLSRVGISIDGGVSNYVFSNAGFSSLVASRNLGDSSARWDILYVNTVDTTLLNSIPVDDIITTINALSVAVNADTGSAIPALTAP